MQALQNEVLDEGIAILRHKEEQDKNGTGQGESQSEAAMIANQK